MLNSFNSALHFLAESSEGRACTVGDPASREYRESYIAVEAKKTLYVTSYLYWYYRTRDPVWISDYAKFENIV